MFSTLAGKELSLPLCGTSCILYSHVTCCSEIKLFLFQSLYSIYYVHLMNFCICQLQTVTVCRHQQHYMQGAL